uniref:Thioredoxin domain-containing protein n=2 Tax=Meloidogyne incognita group TaxID=654580 RepID=A0A915N883_MELJA
MKASTRLFIEIALIAASGILINAHDNEKKVDLTEMYKNPLSNGFGDDIDWIPWENAVETALERNKPVFLLIHKTWCHACKSLKKVMQQSNARKAFKKLSEYFVMVNTADDDEPYEEEYRPDGKYVPRILFLDKNGDLLPDFKNKKAEYKNYAYYYPSPADILNSMKEVIAHYGIELSSEKKGDKLKPVKPPPKKEPEAPETKKDKKKVSDNETKKAEKVKEIKEGEKKKTKKESSKTSEL